MPIVLRHNEQLELSLAEYHGSVSFAELEAVAAFLDGKAPFLAIPETIQEVLDSEPRAAAATLEDVLEADRRARERARGALARRAPARVHSA